MLCCLSRFSVATELDTAPSIRPLFLASSSMKKLTVLPVPTPITALLFICSIAAFAAFLFSVLVTYRSAPMNKYVRTAVNVILC